MTEDEVLLQLEEMGTEQNRKTYHRHGIKGTVYGVSYANLNALKKKIKTNQELAEQLWDSNIHEAQVLATMIADPATIEEKTIDAWGKELMDYVMADAVAGVAARTPFALKKLEKWIASKDESVACLGWGTLARLARTPSIPDEYFLPYLNRIERDIHTERNRVRYVMNGALIAIGTRGGEMQQKALAAAGRIGQVDIDHGDTSCKTPGAADYILKAEARRKMKETKATE